MKNDDTLTARLCFHKLLGSLDAAISKETLSSAENYGMDHEPILIYKVVLHQRLRKCATARDQDILTRLLP